MAATSLGDASRFGVRRTKSQVFVEIPASPLLEKPRAAPQPPKVPFSQHQGKENNVPPSTKGLMNNSHADVKLSAKRKVWSGDASVEMNTNLKKAKMDDGDFVICHQCRSKRLPDAVLQCTSNMKATGKRCKASYCSKCLKTRYGEKLEIISQARSFQPQDGHSPDSGYHFTCPRCSDFCNCGPCRKKKGLPPVGKFLQAKEGESVREILEKNPKALGLLPRNMIPRPAKIKDSAVGKNLTGVMDHDSKTKAEPVPEPVWRPLSRMTTRKDIEDRIHLREFILRFNSILDIGLRNVEELDDFMTLHDQSTKAVLLSLLDLIAVEDDIHKKTIQAALKKIRGLGLNWTRILPVLYELGNRLPEGHALRSLPMEKPADTEMAYNTRGMRIQTVHVNQLLPMLLHLVEVASVGESVRQELEEGVKEAKEIRSVYSKIQRDETERWAAERGELAEERQETEKNKISKTVFKAKYRDAEKKHKSIMFDIHNSYKPRMDVCSPRFMPLGIDIEGRTYYALSASGPHHGKKERLPSEGERSKKLGWFISVWGKPGTVVLNAEDTSGKDDMEIDPDAERWWKFSDVQEIRKLSKWLMYRADTDMPDKERSIIKWTPAAEEPAAVTSNVLPSLPSSARNTMAPKVTKPAPSSPATVFDSDSEEHGMKANSRDGSRIETNLSLPATQEGMKALAKSLLEFANFIEWRIDEERTSK